MLGALWKAFGRHVTAGAAVLSVAGVVHAQQMLPPVEVVPAVVQSAPPFQPIVQAGGFVNPNAPRIQLVSGNETSKPGVLPAPANEGADLKARIDRLEKQNQELLEVLKSLQNRPAPMPALAPASTPLTAIEPNGAALSKQDVQKMVNEYLSSQEPGKAPTGAAAIDAGPKMYTVGKSLGLTGVWTTGPGAGGYQPWFETEDKSYRIHFGGRFHPDWVFGTGSDDDVASGKGGTGPFRESFDLRRARLEADGWIGEVVDFFVEFDFVQQLSTGAPFTSTAPGMPVGTTPNSETNTFTPVSPTDVWASINHIPVIGGLRVGNLKFPLGLDHLTSSRFLDFMERSSGFDTYYNRANGWEPGAMIFNTAYNDRLSWQLAATRHMNQFEGLTVGGGEWRYSGRLTALPWYQDNGCRMVHIGVGACYIDHLDLGQANLVGRWLLRNGGNNLQNVVGLARVFGTSQSIVNPELFINLGPLSIQAEYIASQVQGVTSYVTPLTGPTPAKIGERSFFSQAAYVQAMYFLTGEYRPYGKNTVHSSGPAPTRVVPHRNYFWVPGHGGSGNPFSAGAWQVGARYSYNDLTDGAIAGGVTNEVTFGLNWFLNPNMKFQWNYDIGYRTLTGGTSDGYYNGFGMRMAFDF